MADTAASTRELSPEWPGAVYAWYVIALLSLANVVSLVDRQILALLVEPVRNDLGITDTGISLLHGFAFALFFSVMALPIARVADVRNRRNIIVIGIALWSAMTALCGLAKTFLQLFVARMGVGVGEATLNPSAYSIMSDYFPPERRALPMGVFAAGIPIGVGVSLFVGAWVIDVVSAWGPISWPLIGAVQPWQMVFLVIGVLGLPVALLMLTVKEPVRRPGSAEQYRQSTSGKGHSLREVMAFFRANRATYLTLFTGYTVMVSSASGINAWTPTFYIRSFGLSASEAGYLMGVVALIGGPLGAIAGGAIADWLQRRGIQTAKLRVLLCCALLLPIPGILGPLMPTVSGAVVFLFLFFVLGSATAPTTLSAIQEMTPNQMRGQATALLYFLVNLIGIGLGPFAVALLTDYVFNDELALRYSISIYSGIAYALAIILIMLSFAPYKRSINQ